MTFKFYIDFDRDGTLDVLDDISAHVLEANWNLGFREAEQLTADESRCTLTLRNSDKRFSPEGTASPYYPNFKPQRLIQIKSITADSGTVTHWTGWIDQIQPSWNEHGEQRCVVVGVGAKQFYEMAELSLPLMENVTADDVLAQIIPMVQVPPSLTTGLLLDLPGWCELDTNARLTDLTQIYDLEAGQSTFAYVGDQWDSISAYRAINDVVAGERGRFFFDRDGKAIFWNRNHLAAIYTNDGTVTALTGAEYDYGVNANVVRVMNYPRNVSVGTDVTLWQLEDQTRLSPAKSRTFKAQFAGQESDIKTAAKDVQTPTVGTGTLAYTPADANINLSMTAEARNASITIENNDAREVYITTLVVKGRSITAQNEQEFVAEDVESRGYYGRKEFVIDTPLLGDETLAESIAHYELGRRKDAQGHLRSVSLRPRTSSEKKKAIDTTLGTRIRFSDSQLEHADDYFIIGEQHRVAAGMLHDVTWRLQKASQDKIMLLNVVGRGEMDSDNVLGI